MILQISEYYKKMLAGKAYSPSYNRRKIVMTANLFSLNEAISVTSVERDTDNFHRVIEKFGSVGFHSIPDNSILVNSVLQI